MPMSLIGISLVVFLSLVSGVVQLFCCIILTTVFWCIASPLGLSGDVTGHILLLCPVYTLSIYAIQLRKKEPAFILPFKEFKWFTLGSYVIACYLWNEEWARGTLYTLFFCNVFLFLDEVKTWLKGKQED